MPKEDYTRKQGRIAAGIFWGTSLISLLLVVGLVLLLEGRHFLFLSFLFSFIFCLFITTAACRAVDKRSGLHKRLPLLLLYLAIWLLVCIFPAEVWSPGRFGWYGNEGSLATSVMEFAACMLPAHYWHQFSRSPNRRNAWTFITSFFLGVLLFGVVQRYGNLANLYVYNAARGRMPTAADISRDYVIFPDSN